MTKSIITYFLISISIITFAQGTFRNPILQGAYPDPSICRVGEDFYMVNSSFEYYPGLPVHISKDLVNWEFIGYGLHREQQVTDKVNLRDVQSDGGIHAPTIRYNKGVFYIITTNVYYDERIRETQFVNFIITAKNAEGPWSDPIVLEGAPGIDPDIFFDDDGTVWYTGTHSPLNPDFPGQGEIWLQEIDLNKGMLKGERSYLWRGACGGVWVEGPHLYKHDGRYYLLVAEGGTSFNHAVMMAVSDSIRGPYIPNDRNPVFTHRHLSYDHWVHSTGHADLCQLNDGRWYMVLLGVRGDEGRNSNMGRETHLIPVTWEREPFEWKKTRYEWLVCSPETGRLMRNYATPYENSLQKLNDALFDGFDQTQLGLEWNYRRVPIADWHDLTEQPGFLRLYASDQAIENRKQTSLLGVRQKESEFVLEAKMLFNPVHDYSEAGISLFQKDNNYILFTIIRQNSKYFLQLVVATPDKQNKNVVSKLPVGNYQGEIQFRVRSEESKYTYEYSLDGGSKYNLFTETAANLILSKGYTGAYFGFFAHALNSRSDFADFDWIRCKY
jgi:alpha-N-arabinofuranosidase